MADSPNIILVCSDQHRASSIGAYGNPVCRTPSLDRLAGQGVLLERCFAQNPVCSPSRASIMTGTFNRRNGVVRNGIPLRRDLPTIADLLGARGYSTAAVGKMHLTPHGEGPHEAPYYGFDHLEQVEDNKVGRYLDWALKEFPEYEGYIIGTCFNLPTAEDYWRGKRDLRKEYLRLRQEHVIAHEIGPRANWGFGHWSPLPEEAHHTRWITDRAISIVDEHDAHQPLLLWVGYVDPHNPFDPPGRFRDMYSPDQVDPRHWREGEREGWPPHTRNVFEYSKDWTEGDFRTLRALYYGSVSFVDEQIGRLVSTLERKLDMANTIVVYTADHGELLGDHGLHGKQAYHYDGCIRVPMICRWDGHWQAGARHRDIVELTGLTPSLLDAAGVRTDAVLDGRTFAPLLAGDPLPNPRGHAYCESYNGAPEDPSPELMTWARTIRSDRWRATFYPEADYGELFDMDSDPQEVHNLWSDPQYKDVVEDHRRILLDRLILMDYPIAKLTFSV